MTAAIWVILVLCLEAFVTGEHFSEKPLLEGGALVLLAGRTLLLLSRKEEL